jgi:hypothetical protein
VTNLYSKLLFVAQDNGGFVSDAAKALLEQAATIIEGDPRSDEDVTDEDDDRPDPKDFDPNYGGTL